MNNDRIIIRFQENEEVININEVFKVQISGGVALNYDEETGKIQLLDRNNKILSEIDLPTERIIKAIIYDETTSELVFKFDYAQEIRVPIGDLFNLEDYFNKTQILSLLEEKANKSEIPTKISELENDKGYLTTIPSEYVTEQELENKGYLTEHQDLSDYAKKNELFDKDYNKLINKPNIPDKLSDLEIDMELGVDEEEVLNIIEDNSNLVSNDYILGQSKDFDETSDTQIPTSLAIRNHIEQSLKNYYLKSETYTQQEINELISLIPKFSIQVVSSLPASNISATSIYLVPSGDGNNLYTEYIYTNNKWELLGSQSVDLTGYATEEFVETAIENQEKEEVNATYSLVNSTSYSGTPSDNDVPTTGVVNNMLTPYAKKSDVPTKLSQLENDSNFANKSDLENKVDKVSGKGLSSNDFTDEEKEKLSNLSNNSGAELYIHTVYLEVENNDPEGYPFELISFCLSFLTTNPMQFNTNEELGEAIHKVGSKTVLLTLMGGLADREMYIAVINSEEDGWFNFKGLTVSTYSEINEPIRGAYFWEEVNIMEYSITKL